MPDEVPAADSAPGRVRVLLVTPFPPPVGGIGTWAETLLSSSLAERFDVAVLDTSPDSTDALRGGNRLRVGRTRGALRSLRRAHALLRSFRPDLVHVNTSYYWGFLRDGAIVWVARRAGRRVILHLHGGDFDVFLDVLPAMVRALVVATLRRCDRVVVLTAEMQRLIATFVEPARIARLPNFVDCARFDATSREAGGEFVEVLFVGWVIETKGVRELLRAAKGLPGARFTLAGPIDEGFRDEIEAELEALGERVRLLGRLDHGAIRDLLTQVDVFALPTHREGFPVSVLEAMAAGLPIVATPVGAIPDAVRDGRDGFLVPVGDAEALESRLRELIEEPQRRKAMGQSARARARENFDVEAVVADLIDVYAGALSAEVG